MKNQARYSILPRQAVIDPELSETEFRVLAVIGLHLNADFEAWPSQETIAELCGKSRSTIIRTIQKLETRGYIMSRKKYPNRPGTHKCYAVVMDGPEMRDDTSESVTGDTSGSNIQDATSGSRTLDATSHKNDPVERPSRTILSDADVQKIWEITPKASKDRSSKKLLTSALEKLVKQTDVDVLLRAWKAYLAAPDVQRENFKFVPAVHRWFTQGRWEEYATVRRAPDLLTAEPELHEGLKRERWESGIAWYVESGGGWDLDAWSPPPHKPGCKAPADLLAKAKPVADWILESTGGRV